MSDLDPVLAGTRILVTSQRRSPELAGALERRGADVRIASVIGVEQGINEAEIVDLTKRLVAAGADTVVVTTAIGFRGWCDAAEAAGLIDHLLDSLAKMRLVVRGPKALGALQAAGLKADWVADSETSVEIVEHLLDRGVAGQRIVVQHHAAGDAGMESRLAEAGAEVLPFHVYRWGSAPDPEAVVDSVLECAAGSYDAVVFTSAAGAVAWLSALAAQGVTELVRERVDRGELLVGVVGPVTADPLLHAGFATVWPDRSRMGALVRLIITTLGERSGIATTAGVLRMHASGVTLDHEALPVSPSGLAVLRRLAVRPGTVVSKAELLEALPGESDDLHSVEVAVARLREVLGQRPLVKTVIKRGYQLQLA